jgi:RNA 3'-terminal phosphate cyclase (ATP)
MQCLLPAMLRAEGPISLQVRGGTDVQWSPTVDYFRFVFLPALRLFGAKVDFELLQRGYYPKGQGSVALHVEPGTLQPAHLLHATATAASIQGISHCGNLPEHVARRQAEAAVQELKQAGFDAEVKTEILRLPSMGSGITLWSDGKGASSLGERGLPAERVGQKAAQGLITEMKSEAAVDVHLADQLIPYLALAGGSYTAREVSLHARTNIWTAAQFLEREIHLTEDEIIRFEAL